MSCCPNVALSFTEVTDRGGGKSYALSLDPLYDIHNPRFKALIFRKNLDDHKLPGGLLDKGRLIYAPLGAIEKSSAMKFVFPSGAEITYTHAENESRQSIESRFKGLEIPFFGADEIDQLKFSTIFTLLQSNRNSLGIRNRFHGSCNPSCDTWLRIWLDWYIGDDGYIIPERDGAVRYFFLAGDQVEDTIWGDSKEEVYQKAKHLIDAAWKPELETKFGMTKYDLIKDFQFIKGDLAENAKLIESDPSYVANIAQGGAEAIQRNLQGNWNISQSKGDEMVSRDVLEKKMFDNAEQRTGRHRTSVDVALKGKDNCVMISWDGLHIEDIGVYPYFEDDEIIKAVVKRTMDEHNVRDDDMYYDCVGNGQVLLSFKRAFGVQPKARPLNDDESFATFKDQIMWQLGNLILNGKISIDESLSYKRVEYGNKGKVSIRDIITEEIKVLKIIDSDGKTKMLGKIGMKKELGHSPDLLEAMAYGVIHTLQKKKEKSKKKGIYNL